MNRLPDASLPFGPARIDPPTTQRRRGNTQNPANVATYRITSVEEGQLTQCVTCGTDLHPERAKKYNYCTSPECQEKNLKGLTMVAVGQNKAAEEFLILDERTKEELASGKYRDQRRGYFGSLAAAAPHPPATKPLTEAAGPRAQAPDVSSETQERPPEPTQRLPEPAQRLPEPAESRSRAATVRRAGGQTLRSSAKQQWTASQQRLALLYNEQGLRPAEIAHKLGVSEYLATQIVLAARRSRRRA